MSVISVLFLSATLNSYITLKTCCVVVRTFNLIQYLQTVANYNGNTPGYVPVPGKSIHWPGGRTEPPPNTPLCGFKNDNPICDEKGEAIDSIADIICHNE